MNKKRNLSVEIDIRRELEWGSFELAKLTELLVAWSIKYHFEHLCK